MESLLNWLVVVLAVYYLGYVLFESYYQMKIKKLLKSGQAYRAQEYEGEMYDAFYWPVDVLAYLIFYSLVFFYGCWRIKAHFKRGRL